MVSATKVSNTSMTTDQTLERWSQTEWGISSHRENSKAITASKQGVWREPQTARFTVQWKFHRMNHRIKEWVGGVLEDHLVPTSCHGQVFLFSINISGSRAMGLPDWWPQLLQQVWGSGHCMQRFSSLHEILAEVPHFSFLTYISVSLFYGQFWIIFITITWEFIHVF